MKCKICGYNGKFESFKVKELHFGFRDIFEYIYCPACGCLQISDIPKNLSKYYPSTYYSFQITKSSIKDFFKKLRDDYIINKNKWNLLGFILSVVRPDLKMESVKEGLKELKREVNKNLNQVRILDIGCGEGSLLHQLNKIGFKYLEGIDPYINQTKYHDNIKIYKTSLLDFNVHSKYDLIMFHHSFEHLTENPFEILNKVHLLLNNKGLCIIRMPTTSSFAWEFYKENWVQIDAPRHIVIYSIRGIEILAEKTGFSVEKIYYDSTEFQFIGSEQYKKDIALYDENSWFKNPNASIFSKKDINKYKKLAQRLNKNFRGDQICVLLKKKL
jgi:2-polyprenyl-3-methyl-5-hydroxy-6-metoxy-1,4-benzoquinol methylase